MSAPASLKGTALAQPMVNLRHKKLDRETTQPLSSARVLIQQGGWEVDDRKDRNTDDVKAALKDVKSGYVGGDEGSRSAGGEPPPEPSGRAPQPTSTTTSTSTRKGDS